MAVNNTAEQEKLVTENLKLVTALCKRFLGKGIEFDDLYGAGCEGLVKASRGFDKSRGLMFSTYAVPVILGEIKRLFRDGGEVKVSRSVRELYLRATREKQRLESLLLRDVTLGEIAKSLNEPTENVIEAFCSCKATVSLTLNEDSGEENDIAQESKEEEINNRITIDMALSKLSEKEEKIIRYRYFNFLTQSETAKKLSMTQVGVSRAEKVALIKLRKYIA